MHVRPATPDDLEQLVANAVALAKESEGLTLDEATVRKGVLAALTDPAKATYYLLEDNGVVASLFVTREWSDWNNGWYWWIQGVYVAPARRREGLYTALYDAVREAAAKEGVQSIRLYVHEDNPARAAYEAHGMELMAYRIYES